MENTKIGNKEAIALLTTISFNQIIIFGVKSIINNTSSASLLNLLYLSIIILIFTILICYLLWYHLSLFLVDLQIQHLELYVFHVIRFLEPFLRLHK